MLTLRLKQAASTRNWTHTWVAAEGGATERGLDLVAAGAPCHTQHRPWISEGQVAASCHGLAAKRGAGRKAAHAANRRGQ
jgi:hypothetical protein